MFVTRILTWAPAVALLAAASVAAAAPPAAPPQIYKLDAVVPLKGAQPSWDYLTFDAARSYLFIGRRAAGVTVYDVKNKRVVGDIRNAAGANIATLVPDVGRGYTANADGSTTIFDLASLKTLSRVKLGEGADAAFYDPATKQLAFTMGDTQQLTFIDAATARITGHVHLDADEIEGVAPDGKGALYVAERDKNRIAKIDAASHTVIAEWPIAKCDMPTGVAFDAKTDRLFVGCKGPNPVLAVMDGADGRVVAQMEIGRGNDTVRFDPDSRKVYTSNGVEGNIVIFDQVGADDYKLYQAVTTRPIARTMAIDPATKKIYTVTAEGMVDPSKKVNRGAAPFYPNLYFDDTFTILEYGLHPMPTAPPEED
jgi:DNA-binding beta-propeller fold protein YncE